MSDPRPSIRSLGASVYLPSFMLGVGQGAVVPMAALAAVDAGASVPLAGAIVALRGFGTMAFDVPAGLLTGRLGERRAMTVATAALVVSLLGCAASTSPAPFALFTLLMGCAWSVWLLARLSYVTELMPVELRGRALSTLGGVNRVGNFAGPVVAAAVVGAVGLDGAFYVHAATAIVGCAVLMVVPDPYPLASTLEDHRPRFLSVVRSHRDVFLTVGAGTMTIGVLRASRQVALPLWAAQVGLAPSTIGLVFGLSSAVDMLLFYPAGLVSDRWGRRFMAIPCLAVLAVGHVLLPLTASLWSVAAVSALLGIGNGLGSGIVMTLGADFAPEVGRAGFLGAFRLVGDAGTAAGPVLVSAATAVASLGAAALLVGVVGLLGTALVSLRMPESLVTAGAGAAPREPKQRRTPT